MILTKLPKKISQKTSPLKLSCNLSLQLKLPSASCSSQTFISFFTYFATFFLMSIISNFSKRCQVTHTTTVQLEESNCILLYRKWVILSKMSPWIYPQCTPSNQRWTAARKTSCWKIVCKNARCYIFYSAQFTFIAHNPNSYWWQMWHQCQCLPLLS